MPTTRTAQRVFVCCVLGTLLAATVLIGCGGGGGNSNNNSQTGGNSNSNSNSNSNGNSNNPPQTQLLFVADAGNSRVLLYDASFTTGQSATTVLGQASFTSTSVVTTPTAASLTAPYSLAVAANGTVYVSDLSDCRVLQYNPPFTTGMAASLAIGQPSGTTNLTSNACHGATTDNLASATSLDNPTGIALDSSGNLWVSDTENMRVLKYPAPITAGEAATVVLGQTSFGPYGTMTSTSCTGAATELCIPAALAFDSAGNLWIADTGNSRVVMYPAANLVTGGTATVVLGQPGFNSNSANNPTLGANTMYMPMGLGFDASGNLWVADTMNSRVLMYAEASLTTNGAAATLELGQPAATAFTSNTPDNPTIGPSTLAAPAGVAFDSSGRLFVTDSSMQGPAGPIVSNRTLVFTPSFTNGMNATLVLGQQNFVTSTANTGGEGPATQSVPVGVVTAP